MNKSAWIYIVDDDDDLRHSLEDLIKTCGGGWRFRSFASGEAWLRYAAHEEPGCVLLDLHLPGTSGLDVLGRMRAMQAAHETIVLTGEGNVAAAVAAMSAGALNFLEKPVAWTALRQAVEAAFIQLDDRSERQRRSADARARVERLSSRERDVLMGLIEGLPNKLIAQRLGLSPRTVEAHRASIMEKMALDSFADLLKCAFAAGLVDPRDALAGASAATEIGRA